MTKEEKKILRADLFRHLDGIVTAPTAFALNEAGVLSYIQERGEAHLDDLIAKFEANEGYLNVGLHVIAAQGWIDHVILEEDNIIVRSNNNTAIALSLIPLYKDVVELIQVSGKYHSRRFEKEPFLLLERIFKKFQDRFGLTSNGDSVKNEIEEQILKHIEGVLVGPTVVALGMGGMFHKYFMEASFRPDEFHGEGELFERLLDIFAFLGWFEKSNGTFSFTEKGLFYARRASAYGVTVSYIPMFRKVSELMFGNPSILWDRPAGSDEIHVDREMNVWGSGGAHSTYFKKIDEIIIDIFNQPIELQPKGIVDMGCGNGAFLIHLFDVIEQRTLRGSILEDHPLFLVGADYNQAALSVTRKNIIQADIWAKVIFGDIGDPDGLASDLENNYKIQLEDLLNVRTFLDHNRIWSAPAEITENRKSLSKGAFAYRGERKSNAVVEDNLLAHLQKWAPYVKRFGLLVIELHTIAPELIAQNLGSTAATAYNATHGFSDQYIVEVEVFNQIAAEAGLYPDMDHFVKFPNSSLSTVSINLLKAK